ncbi:MAG: PTS sugar transporter subunit IIC [Erysipelotrichaceae bacterium]|nr:PTS sugar transporter subunit IIC [Erysipelotrichaceae bacterium]
MDKFIEKLSTVASKLANNKIIKVVSSSLMALMPALMIGSVGSILQQIPFAWYTDLVAKLNLGPVFQGMVNVSTNMLGLFTAFSVGYHYAQGEKKDGFTSGILSLIAFLLITPMETVGEGWFATTNLPLTWLGSTGLFTGMIVALVSAKLYCYLVDHNITIKLPDSVPPFISKSFTGIIPGILVSLLWVIVNILISLTPFGNLHSVIYGLIAAPLQNLGGSVWAAVIAQTLTGLCWFCGVHGMAVAMVIAPIWMAADAANVSAISAGMAPTNIITNNWIQTVGNIGGAGATYGLVILMLLAAKSKRYKDMGKLAIVPTIFSVNEPVTYGVPCMLNPILAIPYIFLPPLLIALSYILVTIGILPVGNGIGAPASIPVLMGFFNMGWRGALWNIVEILISVVVYFPFFKALDNQAVKEESGEAE